MKKALIALTVITLFVLAGNALGSWMDSAAKATVNGTAGILSNK